MKLILRIIFLLVILAAFSAFIPSYFMRGINEVVHRNSFQAQDQVKKQKIAKLRDKKQQKLLDIKEKQETEKAQRLDMRKQQTWYAWYNEKVPKGCDNWQSDRHMVECINHKMDSKVAFEKVWNSQQNAIQK